MGKIISGLILGFVIAVVVAGIYAFTKKPKVVLDANGFPIPAKEGDKFTKNGSIYTYINGVWVIVPPPPPEEQVLKQASGSCPDWSGVKTVDSLQGQIHPPIVEFDIKGLNVVCPSCIVFNGVVYNLFASTTHMGWKRCSYKK